MVEGRTNTVANWRQSGDCVLALEGGTPVRSHWLPYGHQDIDEQDISAVVTVLRSDWLTQGPAISEFESRLAELIGVKHAVAYSNGTSALHGAYFAAGISAGDEIITSPITFVATANAALYLGAVPKFADVEPTTGNIDPDSVRNLVSPKTKAIVGVDFAGHPCEVESLRKIAKENGAALIVDAAHSLGATYGGKNVGTFADLTTFSFHPVKTITTGEGGMVVTNDDELSRRLRIFRTHGIEKETQRLTITNPGPWYYEMQALGNNYRISDIQAALGASQLNRLPDFIARRRSIADQYREALQTINGFRALEEKSGVQSAYHLFPILMRKEPFAENRRFAVEALHAENIGVQVHYIPVYHHPLYSKITPADQAKRCPNAEVFYKRVLSLPMFPTMTDNDVNDVISALRKVEAALP